MNFIKIEDILRLSEEELKKINFHSTLITNIESNDDRLGIDEVGLQSKIGDNSRGEFGNEQNAKVFFSQGLDYALQEINKGLRLVMYSIENCSNEKGQKGMHILGIDQYYDEINETFGKISKNELEMKNITPELKNKFFSIVKKFLEARTYYILDLNGCTREEYEKLDIEDKEKIDYLSDDYNEEYFKRDENGNKTIPDPEHLVTPNNMHTIIGQGVSVEKTHRIVKSDGSILNGYEAIMKLCQKYKEINHNEPLPLIKNKDGTGDNWLEEFYEQFVSLAKDKKSPLIESAIEATETRTQNEDINNEVIAIKREFELEKEQINNLEQNDDNNNR